MTQAASEKDISKAYRKRSLELQHVPFLPRRQLTRTSPDKNPDVKNVADRFARLGTIAGILRDGEKRKRYDQSPSPPSTDALLQLRPLPRQRRAKMARYDSSLAILIHANPLSGSGCALRVERGRRVY